MKLVIATALLGWLASSIAIADEPVGNLADLQIAAFEKKIRPLLHKHCFSCHATDAKTIQAGLVLDSRQGLHRGGDSGTVVVPGKPKASLLITAIEYNNDELQMPPKGKLSSSEIATLHQWVKQGAPFPETPNKTLRQPKQIDFDQGRQFWSFQPVNEQKLPTVKNSSWPRERLDWFILAKLEQAGLQPSKSTKRATLIRRLSFDLTGLPPTEQQLRDFLEDQSPTAYRDLVNRLLASPHYGERWARHWLDLARYTDRTATWLEDTGSAHLYRDWVVQALNDDMPYHEFVRRQLATDMMSSTGPEDLPALGFLGLSPTYWKELKLPCEIIKVIVADEWEERVDTVSRTFMGLTVACARCHDHKFDPIEMKDYYAMAGVFASSRLSVLPIIDEQLYEPAKKAKADVDRLTKKLAELKKKKPVPKSELKTLQDQIKSLKQTPHYDIPLVHVVKDSSVYVVRAGQTIQNGTKLQYKDQPRDLHLFIRGDPNRHGDVVPRRFLTVLSPQETEPFQQGSGRLELANSITSDAAALTARVIVNRIWGEHFGTGLVSTPSNFGQLGARPTHPELLEDLSARFIASGWSLKWLHRQIVLSATYRQTSFADSLRLAGDPSNQLLSRMNRRRLDIESWRDAMLAASGDLDDSFGGPSIELDAPANRRRTIYSTIHRRDMSITLQIHDFPDPTSHSPQRIRTTTPLQGLYLLNSPFVAERAQRLALRLAMNRPNHPRDQIRFAHELLFARTASDAEVELGIAFLKDNALNPSSDAWRQYAHALLGCNEFLFVD